MGRTRHTLREGYVSNLLGANWSPVISYNTVLSPHRLQMQLAGSQGLLGNWLEENHQYIWIIRSYKAGRDPPPQLQFIVVEGLQYAVLAKWVNGV